MVQSNLPVLHTVLHLFHYAWQDGLKFVFCFVFFLFGERIANSSHMTVFFLDLPGGGLTQQSIKQRPEVKSSCLRQENDYGFNLVK